ncbi:hypothetical protein ACEWY4_008361 [Coilia grayii]|uniref:T-cell surface glycoprotein CD3 epsilon chain n=1 Tax=Coilia grayii TaxID=363190 RepID=A0ABD1KBC9_9TELE
MVFKMRSYIFAFFITAVAAYDRKGTVSIAGTSLSVSCTDIDASLSGGEYYRTENVNPGEIIKEYSCTYSENTVYLRFYIIAKVCENCYDLDAALIATAIAADLLLTGGIIIITYVYGRKKSGSAPKTSAPNPRRNASPSAPPLPSPDYQPLSDFTRSRDTYATVNKTG